MIVGISFKAAFAIVGASVILSLLWLEIREIGDPLQARRRALGLAARLAVVGGIALAAYWAYDSQPSARSRHMGLAVARFWAYVSSGRAPAGEMSESVPSIDLRELLFAASGPLNSVFDLWKTYVPETESFEWTASGIAVPMVAVSLASVLLLWAIVRLSGASREYLTLVVGVYIGVIFSFALVWALNLQISFNVRHFRVVGVLFVPGIVAMLARIPSRAARQTSLALLAVLCLTFTLYYTNPLDERRLARPVGASGFSHIYASQLAVDALSELDSQLGAGNNLIGVPWGQMALDVKNSRVFHMRTALRSVDYFRYNLFSGHVDNLIVVVPIGFEERGETSQVLRAFMLHRDWRRIRPEIEDFVFMYSGKRDDLGEHP